MGTANFVTDLTTGRLLAEGVRIDCGTTSRRRSSVNSRDGRHTLYAAEGVLAALRRCSLEDAFVDIVGTAKGHNVAPLRLAGALVARAQGDPALETDLEAGVVVTQCWGHLLSPK